MTSLLKYPPNVTGYKMDYPSYDDLDDMLKTMTEDRNSWRAVAYIAIGACVALCIIPIIVYAIL